MPIDPIDSAVAVVGLEGSGHRALLERLAIPVVAAPLPDRFLLVEVDGQLELRPPDALDRPGIRAELPPERPSKHLRAHCWTPCWERAQSQASPCRTRCTSSPSSRGPTATAPCSARRWRATCRHRSAMSSTPQRRSRTSCACRTDDGPAPPGIRARHEPATEYPTRVIRLRSAKVGVLVTVRALSAAACSSSNSSTMDARGRPRNQPRCAQARRAQARRKRRR